MRKFHYFIGLLGTLVLLGSGCTGSNNTTAGAAGLFLTTNEGASWESVSVLPTVDGPQSLAGVSVYRTFEDPQDPDALYWASRNYGLFFSYNAGESWQHAPAPLNTGFIYGVAVHPKNKCIIFATNGVSVYKSVDCSRSWVEVHRELRSDTRISSLAFHQFTPYELYMTKTNGDILLSSDQGISWTIASQVDGDIVQLIPDQQEPETLYAATRKNGIYRSDDRGRTWTDVSAGIKEFPSALEYRRFYVDPNQVGHLYWVSTYGILRSTDRGTSWQPLKLITSPGSADIYGFIINPDNNQQMYYTATISGRSVFYSSQDGGVNWQTESLPSGQVPTVLTIHPTERERIYVGFTIPPSK